MCSVIIHVNLELLSNSESSCKPEAVAVAEIPFLPMSRVHSVYGALPDPTTHTQTENHREKKT